MAASFYASVGAKAAVFPVNATASEISKATAYILDKGNDASSVQHYIMCSTIGAAFLALIASAAFALRGIRKTFTLKKLSESADVRRVRNQIYAFCMSVFVSYMLQFWCAAASSPSRVAASTQVSHGNTFTSYFMALLGSDMQLDPPKGGQFCDSCQPRVELLFQFISGFRFVESCLFFAMGPLPVYVCLWSMTSEGTRKLLDSARHSQAVASASIFMHHEHTQESSLQDVTVRSRQPSPASLTTFL